MLHFKLKIQPKIVCRLGCAGLATGAYCTDLNPNWIRGWREERGGEGL